MARYLLVAVDDNDKATSLQNKLDGWEGFQVIGMFYKCTKFCECEDFDSGAPNLPREQKFGIHIHDKCRRPRRELGQVPNNLLHAGVPSQYQDIRINVKEPCMTPAERWTQRVIDVRIQQIADSAAKYRRRPRRKKNRA